MKWLIVLLSFFSSAWAGDAYPEATNLHRELCAAHLCPRHFRHPEKCCDRTLCAMADVASVEAYLWLIPRPYESMCGDCYLCGSPFWVEPDSDSYIYCELDKELGEYFWCGWDPKLEHTWYPGYFDANMHQYFSFFRDHLLYCSQNPNDRSLWPELGGTAERINNQAYDCFNSLCSEGVLDEHYYQTWPNLSTHGQVCALVVYPYFYSHYHAICSDICQYVDLNTEVTDEAAQKGIKSVQNFMDRIQPEFISLYSDSIAQFPHPKLYYERGLVYFHQGSSELAVLDVRHFINIVEDLAEEVPSELYHNQGQIYLESGQYDRAIEYLSKAIRKNPERKEIYLDRASCYLEMGDIDFALMDYFKSGCQRGWLPDDRQEPDSIAFAKGFMGGACDGAAHSLKEWIPSTIRTLHGIGRCLWAAMPVPGANQRAVEILSGVGVYKVVKYARTARRANYLATLEAATTKANKEALIARAAEQAQRRQTMLRSGKLKIQWDKQGKHLKGHHNYRPGKSVFDHPDPQRLVTSMLAKGYREATSIPAQPAAEKLSILARR